MGYNARLDINGWTALTDVVLSYQPVNPSWAGRRNQPTLLERRGEEMLEISASKKGKNKTTLGDKKPSCGYWEKFYWAELEPAGERINQQLLENCENLFRHLRWAAQLSSAQGAGRCSQPNNSQLTIVLCSVYIISHLASAETETARIVPIKPS